MKRTHLALAVALALSFTARATEARGANTITQLIPVITEALDVVSRELVGMVPAVNWNSNGDRVGINQTIRIPITPAATTADIVPGQLPPDDGDQTIGFTDMTISKSKYSPVRWTGEEQKQIDQGIKSTVVRDQFAQSMRALVNLVEIDLAALYVNASRAYGTSGTAPFGVVADMSDLAQSYKILVDNGAPTSMLRMVFNTTAGANMRGKQSTLFKVNEAGNDDLLRRGKLGDLEGFALGESAGIRNAVKGTGAGYTTTAAGFAVGTTSIPIITGAGTVVAGDVVTFAGDTNQYVVTTGVGAPGTIVIGAPGLLQAIPAVATAMTITNNFAANMAFSKTAMHLITRAPAMPDGGDAADDVMQFTDPVTGLSFQVAVYRLYRRIKYEIGLAWGVKCTKPEHLMILKG